MQRRILIGTFFITLMITACVESFDLPVRKGDVNFLVVDGFLNSANGDVNVNLLRATLISESHSKFEDEAIVMLEDSDANSYALTALDSGHYQGVILELEAGKQYRLYIKTSDGKAYRSDFITLKPTPEIKEVNWKPLNDGIQIIVDTEDETNSTRYYQWSFEETWEYRSRFASSCLLVVGGDSLIVLPRTPEQMINVCYRTQPSTQIFTTSTSGLTQDQVNDFELGFLPKGTEKLGYQYSILVKQYAISKETYEYLERLKDTSQDLDGLYAPQPSKVTGNMFNIADPADVVLGYFNAGEATEKRIFITPEELPANLRVITSDPSLVCAIDTLIAQGELTLGERLLQISTSKNHLLVDPLHQDYILYGVTYSRIECIDCRLKGGVVSKPVFWQ